MALPNILKLPNLLNLTTGDVSLPGGKTEEDDANDIETALREAKEEIGLDPSLVDVVTVLEPIVTKVDFLGFFFCISMYTKFCFRCFESVGNLFQLRYALLLLLTLL